MSSKPRHGSGPGAAAASPPESGSHQRGASGPGAVLSYQTGWDPSVGPPEVLLSAVVYCWWLLIGGALQILVGGMYFGAAEEAGIHLSTPELQLAYVLTGILMVTLGFGILRLERWVYWAGLLLSAFILALAAVQIVRRVNGTTITNEALFFAGLNVVFCLYNIYFLLFVHGTRKALRFSIFKGTSFSQGMALCGIVLSTSALALALFVQHVNKHLSHPVLVLVYLLVFVLMIVMAFMAIRLQRWVWWGAWAGAIVLTFLSIDVIGRQFTATNVDVEGIIFSVVNFVFVASVVIYLLADEMRGAVFRERAKQALFSPRTLIGGALLSVFALVIYLLAGQLGKLPVTDAVIGMVMGVVVGLLPGADPTNRLTGFGTGLLLAFASFVVRGGLLPYTNASAAIVVTVMLLIITGITALFRSRTWFVAMLLGAGTMYALAEPLFQAAPTGYLAAAGLAFVGILLGFGLGYGVSSMLELELVPFTSKEAQTDPIVAFAMAGSGTPSSKAGHDEKQGKASADADTKETNRKRITRSGTTSGETGDDDEQRTARIGAGTTSGSASDDDTQQKGRA